MLEQAILVHWADARMRLRIPGRRKDRAYIEALARWTGGVPGVTGCTGNAVTGSLLLWYGAEFSLTAFVAAAAEQGWFDLPIPPVRTSPLLLPSDPLSLARLASATTRNTYQPLMFSTLLGLGLVQTARGQLLPPALTLLWYALELVQEGEHCSPR